MAFLGRNPYGPNFFNRNIISWGANEKRKPQFRTMDGERKS
jgi:hypothetical protein